MLSPSRHQSLPTSPVAHHTTVNQRLLDCRGDFLRYFRRRLGRPEDAEDAFQDFCLKAVGAAQGLKDDEKIDAWLGRILRSTLIDHYRRTAARRRAEAAYGRELDAEVFEAEADRNGNPCGCVRDVLPTLRRDYADILRRADLDEESRKEIAAELGLTTNNVGVRLHRARRQLKERLEKVCPTCRDGGFLDCHCR